MENEAGSPAAEIGEIIVQAYAMDAALEKKKCQRKAEFFYTCTYVDGCLYRTRSNSDYKVHIRRHAGVKPYACTFEGCSHRTSTSSHLKTHMRIHNQIKPFVCNFPRCNYRCTTGGSLVVHQRGHTGERPYSCAEDGCGYRSKTSSQLVVHKRLHKGDSLHECPIPGCGFKASYKHSLVLHTKRNHDMAVSKENDDLEGDKPLESSEDIKDEGVHDEDIPSQRTTGESPLSLTTTNSIEAASKTDAKMRRGRCASSGSSRTLSKAERLPSKLANLDSPSHAATVEATPMAWHGPMPIYPVMGGMMHMAGMYYNPYFMPPGIVPYHMLGNPYNQGMMPWGPMGMATASTWSPSMIPGATMPSPPADVSSDDAQHTAEAANDSDSSFPDDALVV